MKTANVRFIVDRELPVYFRPRASVDLHAPNIVDVVLHTLARTSGTGGGNRDTSGMAMVISEPSHGDDNYRFSSPCDGAEISIAMRWLRGFHRLLERGKTTDGNKDKQQVFIAMRWLRDFHRHAMAPWF